MRDLAHFPGDWRGVNMKIKIERDRGIDTEREG